MTRLTRGALTALCLFASALAGCDGGGGGTVIRLDAGPNGGCVDDGDCTGDLVCRAGACTFDDGPAVEVDITGDWWMLRYHFVDPAGAAPPADVTGARFEQSGDMFTQYADGDPDFVVPGTIEDGTRYVQGGDAFTATLTFSAADRGQGAFVQQGFTFAMRFIRRSAPTHPGGGDWVIAGTDTPATIEVAGDEVTVSAAGTTWRGRVGGNQAVLVNETQGGADEALDLRWEGADRVAGLVYTREANGAPSQRDLAFARPGAPMGDTTPPTVVQIFPQDRNGVVWPDSPLSIVFSEPVDPASVTAQTVRLQPLQPVDGVTYGAGEGLPGTLTVDGATVTFQPQRGPLQEYQTEYRFTVTEGVTDLAGNPLASARTSQFRTLWLAENATYEIRTGDGRLLALGGQEDPNDLNLVLTLEPMPGPRTTWVTWWSQGEGFLLSNEVAPAFGFVEGGDGNGDATAGAYRGQVFSGQVFFLRRAEARADAPAGESPATYYLTSEFQGPDRALSPTNRIDPTLRMEDIGPDTVAWTFRRVGDRAPTQCSADADCGAYACVPDARACAGWCRNAEDCADDARCEPNGQCVSEAACRALGEGQCDGETLRTCVDGEIVETDCASLDEGRRRFVCRASAPGGPDRCVVALGAECRAGFDLAAETWPCEPGAVCTRGPDRWQCELSDTTCDGPFEPYCDGDVAVLLCADYGQPLAFNCRSGANGAACDAGQCVIPEGQGCFDSAIYRCEEGLICGDQNTCRTPPVCQNDPDCGDARLECVNGECALRACETSEDCGAFDCVYGECQESCQATCEARWGAGTWVCDDPGGPCTRQDCVRSGDCPGNQDCVARSHNRIGPRSTDLVCQDPGPSPCDGVCQANQVCSGMGGDSPQERCR